MHSSLRYEVEVSNRLYVIDHRMRWMNCELLRALKGGIQADFKVFFDFRLDRLWKTKTISVRITGRPNLVEDLMPIRTN
jgi:hypothetical protein